MRRNVKKELVYDLWKDSGFSAASYYLGVKIFTGRQESFLFMYHFHEYSHDLYIQNRIRNVLMGAVFRRNPR